MTYKSTCFKALALLVFISTSMFSYSQTTNTNVVFSGVFGGTSIDGNTYLYPTGSEGWAGFANEDVSLYPLSFSDDGEISFTGATAGTDTDVYFRFEYNPYPDTEPSFSTVAVTVSGTAETSYSVDIPSQGANTFSSFLLYLTTLDSPVTLTNVTVTSSGIADPCADITCAEGLVCDNGECIEVAPSALTITTTVCDAASSVQMTGPWWGWDPNGGPAASDNGDGSWTFTFDPAPTDNMEYLLVVDGVQEDLVASSTASEDWSCTPLTDYWSYANRQWEVGSGNVSNVYGSCGECVVISGCMDTNAINFDADATSQLMDQYGNLSCIYASCDDIPEWGCIYADGFGPFNEWFGPYECELYGGTPCTDELSGCMDENASNYDATATAQAYDQYGNLGCIYASCDDIPAWGCIYADGFGAFNAEFGADLCITYGGTPCEEPVAAEVLNITTTVCDAATSVAMTGPWWGWDPAAGPAASDNGDGSWTFTFDPAPTDNMEYLLVVDGVQEDLVASSTASEDWSCTPVTDYWSYANRQWAVGSGDVSNVYGTCGACEVAPSTLTITTTVCDAATSVAMTGPWWGWDPAAGPAASDNGDGSWTFTFDPAPTDNMEYLLVVDGVQEDLVASSTASEDWSCTPLTDYWSYANRQWAVGSGDVSNVYGTCGSCEVESTTATIEFVVDMNGVDQPSADYDNVVVNGSWNGWAGWGVTLSDEDADGVYTGSLEIEQGTTFEYVVAVTGPADGYSGWGMQWGDGCGNANVFATAGEAGSVTTSTLTPGCSEVLGCVDLNASNYDANATAQAYDQYGNLGCIYASCDDIPAWGCIYGDGFGFFNAEFGADLCVTYGGTPCEEPVAVLGCMYANADNYNALANDDDGSCLFPADCLGDLDGDLLAGTSDLLLLLSGFGNVCE